MLPVQISHPRVQVRVAGADVADVALEVLDVDDVEADDGRVEAYIGFGDVFAEVVWSFFAFRLGFQVGFGAVERGEELVDGFFVCFLCGGESGFIDAVVDIVVGPVVGGFNFGLQVLGEENNIAVLLGKQGIKLCVEHANDLRRFVRDNGVRLLVPEGGDGEAPVVRGIDREVEVSEVSEIRVKGVWVSEIAGYGVLFLFGYEAPSWDCEY
jgi:hypothetical protein